MMFTTRILSTLAAVLTLAACGGDDPPGPTPPTPDRTPPTVVEVVPVTGSTISVARVIRITFSEPMRENSLTLGDALAGDGTDVSWPARTTVAIAPSATWTAGADRPLTVDATDVAGNALATLTLTYTVDAALDAVAPTATVLPADGATIATAQTIVVTFSESMATASMHLGGSLAAISDGGVWSQALAANDRLTISPATVWPEGNRTLSLTAEDLAGNPLAPLSLTYTIDAGAVVIDAIPPSGVAVPASGSYLTPTSAIVITYDEPMDTAIDVSGTLSDLASDSWNISHQVLTITPTSVWPDGAGTLTVDATDVAGNPAPTLTLSYTVDGTAPTATATPPNLSVLSGNTVITIQFSEAIEPTSLFLGGSLEAESDGGTWTDADTLVIGPDTTWSTATGADLTIDAADLAGNELTQLDLTYDIDATAPTMLAVSPLTTVIMRTTDPIFITFSETLDRSSLSVAGTLLAAAYSTPTFSNVAVTDDRIRIAPVAIWNVDAGQTLVLDVADLAGNAAATVVLTWDVGVVHVVATGGNPTGPGTQASPYSTITAALAVTAAVEVRVAAGTYNVSNSAPVMVMNGKRLLGGYATDWSAREPDTNLTQIVGSGVGGSPFDAPVTVTGGGGASATVLDGFTVRSTMTPNSEAVGATGVATVTHNHLIATGNLVNGLTAANFSGTIADNTIETNGTGLNVQTGVTGSCAITGNTVIAAGTASIFGVVVSGNGACALHGNWISAVATATGATGVHVSNASTLRNNVIAATATATSTGIIVANGAAPLVQNNTVDFIHRGLEITLGGPLVENNIFLGSLTATGFCIYEGAGSTSPSAVRYNDFYDCGNNIYHDNDTATNFGFICPGGTISTNCSGGTTLSTPNASDNTGANPVLGLDYSLGASSPAAVTTGGNTIAEITVDILGSARTTPYSIGAFERDP